MFNDVLDQAAQPVLERIEDLMMISSGDVPKLLRVIRERLFDPELRVTKLGPDRGRRKRAIEFHKAVGMPLGEFVVEARLFVAHRLLTMSRDDVGGIAEVVGFSSRSEFYRQFRRRFGTTPTRMRQEGILNVKEDPPALVGPFLEIKTAGLGPTAIEAVGSWLARSVAALPTGDHASPVTEISLDSRALFDCLSELSRREGRHDRQRGVELAEAALASLEGSRMALGVAAADLHSRGLARLANARRLATDYEGSERAFCEAAHLLENLPVERRSGAEGEYLCYRGSLRRFQRRFAEARRDLQRAAALCRSTGQSELEAGAWMQLAAVDFHEGDCERALISLFSAERITEEVLGADQHLRLVLRAQLACVQAESGHGCEALRLLPEVRHLAHELEHHTLGLQADWIEAVARRSAGDQATAEKLLIRARKGFVALRDLDHTAIVSLDLALLYESQGRTSEVVSLASEALPVLESLDLPEAFEALGLLRRAIAEDEMPSKLLLSVRVLLRRYSRLSPS